MTDWVGKTVRVRGTGVRFTVERVERSRLGLVAIGTDGGRHYATTLIESPAYEAGINDFPDSDQPRMLLKQAD